MNISMQTTPFAILIQEEKAKMNISMQTKHENEESEHENIHEDETTGDSDARRGSQDEYLYVAEAIHDECWYRNLPVSADETDEDFYVGDEDEYFYAFKTIRERKKRKRMH